MDPVFFIKSTKIGVFYQYGYTDITTFRDPCSGILSKLRNSEPAEVSEIVINLNALQMH